MALNDSHTIIQAFRDFLSDETYPCVAARAALHRNHIPCLVAHHMACPKDDPQILDFIYHFIADFRSSSKSLHSAAVIFRLPEETTVEIFDDLLWSRLKALSHLDAHHYPHDPRVNADPSAPDYSFSLGEEAFFVIGMHPRSERAARRFAYPAIIFNPHAQFEQMRKLNQYEKMKEIVRRRDILYSGSVNPMLSDFGEMSEAFQYSGRHYKKDWTCPLQREHGRSEDHQPKK